MTTKFKILASVLGMLVLAAAIAAPATAKPRVWHGYAYHSQEDTPYAPRCQGAQC
jgi:hypothetical protein